MSKNWFGPKKICEIHAVRILGAVVLAARTRVAIAAAPWRCCPGSPQAGGPFSSAMALSRRSPHAGGILGSAPAIMDGAA